MDYSVEKNVEAVVRLDNGDRVMVKMVIGHIDLLGTNADGTPNYNIQMQPVVFVSPAVSAQGGGKH